VTPALLVLAPIEPCVSGNGLAMRVASFAESAAVAWDVQIAVVPVAGRLPFCPHPVALPVVRVVPSGRQVVARRFAAMLADPLWRGLLADAEPMPSAARAASAALAADVRSASGVAPGTPVLAIRSYLAPLALAVARQLASPWTALDLDDDDESLASAQGDDATAAAYRRLVATFAPRFSGVSLASPSEALAVGRRHGLRTHVVPNAVAVPAEPPPRDSSSAVVLFVANLDYGPNADAAVVLVERVLPALEARTDRPIRIVLVGTYDPDGPVGGLASHRAVTLAGFVDDVSDYYARAAVVVAPLSTGSGTRIKLIEAFARRVPVVTTPVGVAGLAVRHREHVLIGETPEALAAAAADVLGSPTLAQSLTTAALQFVRRHHAAPVVAERVREFLGAASSQGALRR
jgi:glycosyltransferase involved in cell wall biosynthesis